MSPSVTSFGKPMSARSLELAAALAQLRLDVVEPEPRIDLLLGRAGMRLTCLVVFDAVLAHVKALLHCVLAQRDVVLLGAGEMLEEVAELLRRDDPQLDCDAVVGDDPRAGVADRAGFEHDVEVRERLPEGARIGGARDDVDVLAGVGPAAQASGQLDPVGGRVGAQLLRRSPPRAGAHAIGAGGRSPSPSGVSSASRMLRSNFSPSPGTSRSRSAIAASLNSSSDAMPSSSWILRAVFGPRPGMRVSSTRPGGNLRFSFAAAGISPVSSSVPIFSAIVFPTP